MRTIKVPNRLGRALAYLRGQRGVKKPPRLRLQDIEALEEDLSCQIPDPILAYFAAGVSAWGDGKPSLAQARELTLQAHAELEKFADGEGIFPAVDFGISNLLVIDDDGNGNYIAFGRGDAPASENVMFLDHNGWELVAMDLAEQVERRFRGEPQAEPLEVEVYDEPDPEPADAIVTHKKFGRGTVLETIEDKVRVRFEDGSERTLKASFLEYAPSS